MVALEACGGAYHWARQRQTMGHKVRLIPPAYVKPFVKRNKHDAIDAEAICEAAQRPGMRFVAVKSELQQAAGLVFRTRDLAVRQRTQLINAIRRHLAEYSGVAPRGTAHMTMLVNLLEDDEMASPLPEAARPMFKLMVDMLAGLDRQISVLDREIARRGKEDEAARLLMTIPGTGPIAATAIIALAPPIETFRNGRDFAAWLGLAPHQHSTGGKQRLGSISKMDERTIRRLLIIGVSSIVRQAYRFGAPAGSWLERMLARKPRMLVSVALANKMARMVWALLAKNEGYRAPAAVAAYVKAAVRGVGDVGGRRRVWHNSRRDGAEEPENSRALAKRVNLKWIRSVNSHTGSQHMALLIKAGQMTGSDYVPTCPNLPLASDGATTDTIPLTTHRAHSAGIMSRPSHIRGSRLMAPNVVCSAPGTLALGLAGWEARYFFGNSRVKIMRMPHSGPPSGETA